MSLILRNGETWESQEGTRVILQWVGGDVWCLLALPTPAPHGGTCMVPLVDDNGHTLYHGDTLANNLAKNHWRRIPRFGMQLPPADEGRAPGDGLH